jgi:lysophospholipase L1-like esterase
LSRIFIFLCILIATGCSDPKEISENTVTDMDQPLTYLALGDSYTIGEAVEEDDRWPVQLVDSLNSLNIPFDDPVIIARTGWRTDELQQAVASEDPETSYDLVSLLIGVNNQYQGKEIEVYRKEFDELLKTAIRLANGKKENVLVVSIPDYGYTPFGREKQAAISEELKSYNDINKEISEEAGVMYVYITDISENGLEQSSLVAGDGLHPSGEQYGKWVDRIMALPAFRQRYIP